MAIIIEKNKAIIKTEKSVLILAENEGFLEQAYYGAMINDEVEHLSTHQIYGFLPYDPDLGVKYLYGARKYEYSGANTGDFRASAIGIESENGYIGCRLKFQKFEIGKIPNDYVMPRVRSDGNWLKVILEDREKGVEVTLYYKDIENCDVICRFTAIKNTNKQSVVLTKAASLQIDYENSNYEMIYLVGTVGDETRKRRKEIENGKFILSSNFGMTGYSSNPFFALTNKNSSENYGDTYGFNLLYSGNFKTEIEKDNHNNIRVLTGINDENFRFNLASNEIFYTPQAVMTFSEEGIGAVSRNFHDLCRDNILPPIFAKEKRPIVINTWECFHFDVNEEKVIALANKVKEIGVDTLVLDDGWFRNNDDEGLGDWKTLEDKFPSGLKYLQGYLESIGLKLGLWFEMEMVSKKSELYSARPEWLLYNGNSQSASRNQYVLDLSNEKVVDYLYEILSKYVLEYDFKYIKWDANRYLSEVGSPSLKNQGEVWHRYVLGLYSLLERLTTKFPSLMIEGCAGGGARFDLGMLYYEPMIWLSDNTDPYSRVEIQSDASLGYPLSALSYHISENEGFYGKKSSFDFRALAANLGGFGYELNLTKFESNELEKFSEYTNRRKEIEKYILTGDLYRLDVDNRYYYSTLQVLKDKSSALFTFIQINSQINNESIIVRLQGLEESARYKISINGQSYTGRTLMKAGLRISDLLCPHWKENGKDKISLSTGKSGSGTTFTLDKE